MTTDHKTDAVSTAAIISLMCASLASQALIVVLAPAMVRVADDLHTSVGVVSQARSVTAVAAVGLSLILGKLVARAGVGRTIAAGSLAAIVACVSVALSPNIWAFLTAHLLVGVAVAALLSASFAGAAGCGDSTPRALGLVAGANSLAWIVVNPLSGILTEHVFWQAAFAVPALAAVLAAVLSRHAPEPVSHAGPSPIRGGLLRTPAARNWLIAELAAYTAWTAILTFVGFSWWSSMNLATPEADQATALFGNFAIGTSGYAGVAFVVLAIAGITALTSHLTVIAYLTDIDSRQPDGG